MLQLRYAITAILAVSLFVTKSATATRSGIARTAAFVLRNCESRQDDGINAVTFNPIVAAIAAVTISSALMSPAPAVATAPTADIAHGGEIFSANCAGCHAGGMNFVKEKRTLKRDALEKFVGLDQPSVEKFFTESMRHKTLAFPRMPGGKLSEVDITDVTSFVVDQAVNDKW
mmetsp:Transcript_5966/g.10242  ORF Transcript_5966/g.10242 Transcript_5966/m.10242 type:complete len:173 (-) Transcript_5966:115-633(-)